MPTLPRAAEVHQDFIDSLQTSLRGTGVDVRPLSRWSTLGAGLAQMAVRTNVVAVRAFDDVMLDRAEDAALDAYCRARGPVVRHAAAKARGTATFTRPTVAAGAGEIPAGTEFRVPYEGKSHVFVVSEEATISGSATSITAKVEAQVAGKAANVGTVSAALALTGLPAPLFDSTLRPTSITVAGGADEEQDEPMRERHRLWERSRQRATWAAVAFACRLVPGVRRVVLADVLDPHLGAWANAYVGDVNWASTSAMREEVLATLEDWRAMGGAIHVRGLAQSDVTVSATLQMARPIANYDIAAIREAALVRALDYFDNRVDPYAYDTTLLAGRLARVHDEVSRVTLASPAASVSSPISPSAFRQQGFLPTTLTRYRTRRSLVTIAVEGPT